MSKERAFEVLNSAAAALAHEGYWRQCEDVLWAIKQLGGIPVHPAAIGTSNGVTPHSNTS